MLVEVCKSCAGRWGVAEPAQRAQQFHLLIPVRPTSR